MSIHAITERQYGLITSSQLRAEGVSNRTASWRARNGKLTRVAHGVYLVPGAPRSREQLLLAAQLATRSGVPSHRSAGFLWGMKNVTPVRPELIVPLGSTSPDDGLITYRRSLDPSDRNTRGPFRLTRPARTILDLASLLATVRLEVVVDDAVTRRLTTLEALSKWTSGKHRGVRGVRVLRTIVEDRIANGTPASFLETSALSVMRKAGLPRPLSQYDIRDPAGALVARPDLAYPDLHLAIELDGDRYHAGKAQRTSDLARQNRLALAGWTFLRFGADAVRSGVLCSETRDMRDFLNRERTKRP